MKQLASNAYWWVRHRFGWKNIKRIFRWMFNIQQCRNAEEVLDDLYERKGANYYTVRNLIFSMGYWIEFDNGKHKVIPRILFGFRVNN